MSLRFSVPLSVAAVGVGLIALAPPARAQAAEPTIPPATIERPRERANSINVSPIGYVLGAYNVNYERLFGAHGVVVEAGLSHQSDDGDRQTSLGGSLGYRWHWRGRQDSGFLGLAAGYFDGTGEATVDVGGDEQTHDVDVRSFYLVANVGKRWEWRNGFNITLRIGGGYGHYEFEPRSDDPGAEEAADELDDLMTRFPIAVDGEASIGFTF